MRASVTRLKLALKRSAFSTKASTASTAPTPAVSVDAVETQVYDATQAAFEFQNASPSSVMSISDSPTSGSPHAHQVVRSLARQFSDLLLGEGKAYECLKYFD